MMAIVSDEEYSATVSLMLIKVLLNKGRLEELVYKCIRYFSESEEGIDVSRFFESQLLENIENMPKRDQFVAFDHETLYTRNMVNQLGYENYFNDEYFKQFEDDSNDNDESDQEEEIVTQNRNSISSFKNRLSLIMVTLNPKHDEFYPDEDPIESGLLFAVLLRKFSQMLENSRIDNLILSEIWLTISSLPIDTQRPETFYLYAFCFQVCSLNQQNFNSANIGLFNTIETIQGEISKQKRLEECDIDTVLFHRK